MQTRAHRFTGEHQLIQRVLALDAIGTTGSASARLLRLVAVLLGLASAGIAAGTPPAWSLEQIYTNADGSVQFAVFSTSASGQEYLAGHTLITATSVKSGDRGRRTGHAPQAFNFPRDLPGDSANRTFLIATQGFADLQLVQPDYVVPNNFFPLRDGTISLAGVEVARYASPPTDGVHALHSLGNGWIANVAEPINFAGEQYIFAGEHWVVEAPSAVASLSGASSSSPPPTWQLVDAYSSPDRTVQFVVFTTSTSGLQYLQGQMLSASRTIDPDIKWTYIFASDLPGDSAGHSVLIATRGFADLGVLKPDYVVPNGFFSYVATGRGNLRMAQTWVSPYAARFPWTDTAVATNYAGQSYTFGPGIAPSPTPPPPPPPPPPPSCPWKPWRCNYLHSR